MLSPSETWPEVERKVDDWLAAGVREVWLADPVHRSITIRRPDGTVTRLEGEAALQSPLLPGFSVAVSLVFA